MTMPTEELFALMAADRGLDISEERLRAALAMHAKFRNELDVLRSVRLEFLPPYIEPETAVRWIENGGRSE
jgi:hypothetical protein